MSAAAGLTLFGAYMGLGALFALAFVIKGAAAIDPSAKGAPIGFRLLIFPASAALWPLLLVKWLKAARAGDDA